MKLTKRDVDDVYRLDFGPGTAPIFLSEEEMDELRAHLQAERDEQLGRWRDPEDPNMVVYPRPDQDDSYGRCMSLFDESSGEFWLAWERIATHDSSARYFAAHPEPKPWEEAKAGEVWILTRYGAEEPFFVTDGEFTSTDLAVATDLDDPRITDGRRIWPEGENK